MQLRATENRFELQNQIHHLRHLYSFPARRLAAAPRYLAILTPATRSSSLGLSIRPNPVAPCEFLHWFRFAICWSNRLLKCLNCFVSFVKSSQMFLWQGFWFFCLGIGPRISFQKDRGCCYFQFFFSFLILNTYILFGFFVSFV